jgi:hypothetical protein
MVQAHKVICPVHGKQLRIDLPADFPAGGEVEVIILRLEKNVPAEADQQISEWLQSVWGCSIDFPDRLPDLPPASVEIP